MKVYGEDPPDFYDGFESGNFSAGGWATEDGPEIEHDDGDDNKMWTDDNSTASGHNSGDHTMRGHGANIEGDNDSDPDEALIKSFDTTGLQDVKVRYARGANNLEPDEDGDEFFSLYSINGGLNWIELEFVTDDANYASVEFGPLEGANDNPDFKFRF